MNHMLKIAYDAGCEAALIDLGLSKTAEPKWLKMLRADPGLVDEAVLKAGRGSLPGRPGGAYPMGEASANAVEKINRILSLDGQRVGDIPGLLRRRGPGAKPKYVEGDLAWSTREDLRNNLLYNDTHVGRDMDSTARRLEMLRQDSRLAKELADIAERYRNFPE